MPTTGDALNATQLDPRDGDAISAWVASARALIEAASSPDQLRDVKIEVFGDKSALVLANRMIGKIDPGDRAVAGQNLGGARKALTAAFDARKEVLDEEAQAEVLRSEGVDVTVPTRRVPTGALKFSAKTASTLGSTIGNRTFRNVAKLLAPKFRAASSSSSSMA